MPDEKSIGTYLNFMSKPGTVQLLLDYANVASLIGQLQLAFRHPGNTGPSRTMAEELVRDLIERLDPDHGELYDIFMQGFDPQFDL